MIARGFKLAFTMTLAGMLLSITGTTWAQEEPSVCVELGALAWENFTKEDAGGTGSLPEGVENQDYIRCKACHGWDHMATDGGYVRRSRNETRPNAGAGDGDTTSRNISMANRGEGVMYTAADVLHAGTGRAYTEGTGSWVALDAEHSAANKAAHANGYTLGNQHPDYSADSMTQNQADCLAEFLNSADADPSVYFANINPGQNPALYTIVDTADAAAGETFYGDNCNDCHGDPAGESPVGHPAGGILAYLASDGKFSEFSHKARWGIPDTTMTRDAMGSPSSADVADMMLWLQQLGGTGFAMTAGLNGNWWNGLDRSGEGFQIEVSDNGNGGLSFTATFYSYDSMGDQIFLVAIGTVTGNTADVEVFITDGGTWGEGLGEAGTETAWGVGSFVADSCGLIHVELMPNADAMTAGFTDLMYDLMRLTTPAMECP